MRISTVIQNVVASILILLVAIILFDIHLNMKELYYNNFFLYIVPNFVFIIIVLAFFKLVEIRTKKQVNPRNSNSSQE